MKRTYSVYRACTVQRELFYWAAILFTSALGVAARDLATEALQLGFQSGIIAFVALVALAVLVLPAQKGNPTLTF